MAVGDVVVVGAMRSLLVRLLMQMVHAFRFKEVNNW